MKICAIPMMHYRQEPISLIYKELTQINKEKTDKRNMKKYVTKLFMPRRETEIFPLMSIPTILERSLIDSTLKSCCRGASLCVCSKREKWAGEFPELLGLRHQTLCFSFHYQLLTLHCLGPQFLFSSDLW